ncbi:Ig-like domain-containing protein [Photobacterium sp. TY1-4]|uniref:Ig-like domain-containing protein n=1 Tax=Photobacterium sp. TY1-4 TaxID=2899122 RepID=UPI0021C076FE|nr:Ig-like domain-containing protein [Photobacterium sp. TY1-4]UXI03214.1 Ig-like domain-containing protein [Photobacterium sp. TY1-4]
MKNKMVCEADLLTSGARYHPPSLMGFFKYHKVTKLALIISALFSADAAAGKFNFTSVNGDNTQTLTTTVDGVTLTATQSGGNTVQVTAGFMDAGTFHNSESWTITFSVPIDITQFDIGEFANQDAGSFVFTPDNGTAESIATNDPQLSDFIATLTPSDWLGVSSVVYTFVHETNGSRVGIDNIIFTVSASDSTPPTFDGANSTPADNDTNVSVSNNIIIDFDENIALGSGNITIRNVTDSSDFEVFNIATESDGTTTSPGAGRIGITNDKVYLNPTNNLSGNRTYAIRIDPGAVEDSSGNSFAGISDDNTFNFITVSTAPDAPSAPDLDAASDTGISNIDNVTNDTTLTLSGTAESGSTVTLYSDQVGGGADVIGTGTATDGNWQITTSTLAAGVTHAITAKAASDSNNVSPASSALSVTIDTIVPSDVIITTPIEGDGRVNAAEDNDVLISGSGAEAGNPVTVSITDNNSTTTRTVMADTGGNWTISGSEIDVSGFNNGTLTVSATQTDTAGNTSTAATQSITLDNAAPSALTITTPIEGDGRVNAAEDNDVLISGTGAEAGNYVTVSITDNNSTTTRTVTADTGGNWTISGSEIDVSGFNNGTLTVSATQTDTAGNTSTAATQSITLDTTAPSAPGTPDLSASSDTGTSNTDNVTNDTTATFTGSGTTGDTITLISDIDGSVGSATASGGIWTITSSALTAGSHIITARATDTAGNIADSSGLSVTVDTSASAPSITTPIEGDGLVNAAEDSDVLIIGTGAESGASVTVTIDDGVNSQSQTVNADGSGNWTLSGQELDVSGFNNGSLTVRAVQSDTAGNISTAATQSITLDNAVPSALTITTPIEGDGRVNAAEDNDVLISGSGAEAGNPVTVSITDNNSTTTRTVTADTGGNWTLSGSEIDVSGFNNGTLTVSATQTDTAGNTSTAATQSITLDNAAPSALTITTPIEGDGVVNAAEDNHVLIAGSGAEAGNPVTVSITDNNNTTTRTVTADTGGNWTLSGSEIDVSGFNNGTLTVSATQTDTAGNTSTAATQSITLDNAAPSALTITTPIEGDGWVNAAEDNDVLIAGTGAEAGNSVTVTIHDGANSQSRTVTADGSGNWTISGSEFDVSSFNNGTLTVSASQSDAAGNTSSAASTTITLDNTAPSAPSITTPIEGDGRVNAAEDNDVLIAGTGAEAGNSVTVTIHDGANSQSRTVTADGSGNWTISGSEFDVSAFNNGTLTVSASQSDAAGNTSSAASTTITLDNTAPSAPSITTPIEGDGRVNAAEDNDVLITGSGAEAGNSVTVTIHDGANSQSRTVTADGSGNWTISGSEFNVSSFNNGTLTVSASQSDAAGNTSSAASTTITLDNTAPSAPSITTPIEGDGRVNAAEDNDVLIAGTGAEAGNSVTVTIHDGANSQSRTVTADGSGNWTISGSEFDVSSFNNGTLTVSASQSDAAGNTSSAASTTITLDNTAPSAPSITTPIEGDGRVNAAEDNDVLIAGTGAEAGNSVTVTIHDGANSQSRTVTADGSGNWTISGSEFDVSSFNNGTLTVSASQSDAAGNTSSAASTTITLDNTAPSAPSITTPIEGDGRVNAAEDNDVLIAGTGAEAGNSVTVTIHDGANSQSRTVTADGSGNWTISGSEFDVSSFNNGTLTVSASQSDAAGNTSSAASTTITLDNTAPSAPSITTPIEGDGRVNAAEDNDVLIAGTGAEAGNSVTVTIHDGANSQSRTVTADGSGNWTISGSEFDVSAFNNGTLTVSASQSDAAGNTSSAASTTITLDNTAPSAPSITTPIEGDGRVNAAEDNDVLIAGTGAEAGNSVTVTIHDGANSQSRTVTADGSGNWTISGSEFDVSSFNNGTLTVSASQSDAAGNTSSAASTTITLDNAAPSAVTITTPIETDGIVNAAEDNDVLIAGSGAEAGNSVTVTITDNNSSVSRTVTADNSGNWTLSGSELDVSGLNNGTLTVSATQADTAGNTSTAATQTITLDNAAPSAVTITTPIETDGIVNAAEDNDVLIAGSGAESGNSVTVTITDNSSSVSRTVTADNSGNWTLSGSELDVSGLNNGTLTVSATQADTAGNTSTAATQTITLDNAAPSAVTITTPIETDGIVNAAEDNDVLIAGTDAEAGNSVTVTIHDGANSQSRTVTADGSGNWTISGSEFDVSSFNNGTLTVSASQSDAAGNTSSAASTTITLDNTAPSAPSITTPIEGDGRVNAAEDNDVLIAGTGAEAGNSVTVTIHDGANSQSRTVTADGSGNWTISGSEFDVSSFNNGTLTVSASQSDAAGNTSSAASTTITLDNTAPSAPSITTPIEGDGRVNAAEDNDVLIAGTDAEAGNSVTVTIHDGANSQSRTVTADGSGNWTISGSEFDVSAFNNGTLTVSASQSDAAGNTSSAASTTVILDNVIPSVSMTSSKASLKAGETATLTFTLNETSSDFAEGDITVVGGTLSNFAGSGTAYTATFTPAADRSEPATFDIAAETFTDAAGNSNTAATQLSITLDTALPSVTISSDKASLKAGEQATISVTLNEASTDFAESDITVVGGALSNFTSHSGTSYTVTFTPDADSETNATLDIYAGAFTDAAGNSNTAATQLTLNVDTVLPSGHSVVVDQALINRENEAALSFTVSGLEGSGSMTYQVSDGTDSVSGSSPIAIDAESKQVTGVDVSALAEGTLTLSVVVSDEAGNAAESISATVTKKYNVAPELSGTPATAVDEDAAYHFEPTLADPDEGDTHTFSIENKPEWAEFDSQTGALTGTPEDADVGHYSDIQIKVSDGTDEDTLDSFSIEVVNTNDAPVGQDFSFTLDEAATLTVAAENGLLSKATDDDSDSGDTFTASVVTEPQYGQLTLSEDGSFSYQHDGSENHADSFTFQVVDAENATSQVHTVTLTMNAVADAPVTVNDEATTNEDTVVTIKLLDNDYDPEGDMVPSSAAVVVAPTKGKVAIANGVATYTPNDNENGQDSFTYTVKDALLNTSAEATVTVTITPVNDLPVAANLSETIEEDNATDALAVRKAASDIEDGKPTGDITIETQPAIGSVAIDQDAGTLVYTPNLNEVGTDTFTYTITDSEGGVSEPATVTVNIGAVNDRPIVGNDSVTTDEDVATTLTILANDSDIEDQSFTPESITLEDQGNGAGNYAKAEVSVRDDGSLAITPRLNKNGTFSFTYTLTDSEGLQSEPATVTVTLAPVNDAPVAVDNTAQLLEEGSFEVNVLGNDTDVDLDDGDSLNPASVTVVRAPVNGQVQVTSAGAIVYTANENYFGEDTFTYTVKDAAGAVSNEATVTMTVTPVNDAPVAIAQAQMLDEDTTLTLTLGGTDIEDDALVYSITESTSNGELEQLGDNSWRYTPNANFYGADSFKFKVNDGELDSEPVEVTLTVNPVNDAPSVQSLSVNGEEDTDLAITLVGSDVEGSTLMYQMVMPPENGSVLLSGNKVTYQPDANFFGQDSFTYIANDGELDSTPATVTIDIAGVNDVPTISGTPSTAVDEDTAYQFVPVVSDNDSADTLRFSIANKPSWASFDQATGMLSGTPGNGDVGITNNIVISVSDGTEKASLPGFSLTVNNVNDAPVISGNPATEVNEDTAYYYKPQVTDVDSTLLTFSITNKPSWANFDATSGALSGTPDNSHVGTTNGIVISVSDGQASASLPAFNLTVNNVNDAPVGESLTVTLNEDSSATITPTVSDVDQDSLTRKVTAGPSHGVLAATTNGWTYTPTANFNGIDSFQYQVNDGQVSSAAYTVTLNVAAVNDAPVAVDDRFALTAHGQTTFTLDVLRNDSDVDEDTLQLDWVRPTAGQASIQDGKILLTTQQIGTLTVQYGITDGKGGKATAKALVTLESGKLDAPTITAPADVEVNATALSTKVDLGTAVAFDSTGKPLPVSLADNRTFFRPGVNTVYWQTEDSQGNTAEASQTVIVHPLVSIEKDAETTEDTSHTVKVHLNGPAPSYPVTIPYQVSGSSGANDHDLTDGEVVITEGTVGEITFNVLANPESEDPETLIITLDDTLNRGSKHQYTLTIYEQNVAPKVSVIVKQGDDQRSKVENKDQTVTVNATVTDPNAGDSHTYAWVADDAQLAAAIAGQTQGATLNFSPVGLNSAIYHLQLTVTDNGQTPLSVTEDVYLEVVAALAVLGDEDSDGDLIPDNQEGHTDSDNDGIPDYQDAISDCNVIQENVADTSHYLVEGDPGVCLRKGVTVAGNETGGTQLLEDEVKTKLGADETADNIGGIFDFVATGLPQVGQSYRVVFPQRRPIPADAVYRKYKEGLGWVDFVQDAENTLASTQGEAGYCPPPGDSSWTPGLTEGHWCVQLTIQDGGPNDDDGVANGSVVDPGGVAARATGNTAPKALSDTVSVSRNGHIMIDVLANDSDADGHPLTVTNATADFGTVAVVGNWLSYTAKDQYYGVATISYSVSDNNGGTDFANVKVNVVNSQTPVAVDDVVATDDRTPLVIRVLSNDSDPDGDALTVVSAVAQNGTVTINSDQSLSYTPKVGFEGEDTVTYVIRDTNGLEDTGKVTVKTSLTHSVVVENEAGGHTGGLTLALLTLLGFARRVGKRGWLALLALLSFNSQAAWFMETDLGFSNAHKRDAVKVEEVIKTEDTDLYWSVGAGYAFNEQWSLTARYVDMGEGSATLSGMSATPQAYHQQVAQVTPVLADGFGLDVGYAFWQQEAWRAEVSLGGLYWDVDFESRYQGETIKSDSDGFDLYAGADIGYALSKQWTLGINATRYFIEPNDVDTLALKLTYHFGAGDSSE